MLTRLNAIAGVESSSALLANNGNRMVQIRIRPGADTTKVVEQVQKALRAEVPNETPVQMQSTSVAALEVKQDWLTVGQLNELASEEGSSPQSGEGFWWIILTVLIAFCAFFFWLLRRRRSARQSSEVRFG